MSLFDLSGKVAVITGSTKGIGKAIAWHMADHGARVVISSRKSNVCDEVAQEINVAFAKGEDVAVPIPCNISNKDELQNLVDQTIKRWGRIDSLVCNAAINPYFGPDIDCPDSAFDKVMGSNIRSNFWLSNMVLPQMAERNDGTVIIVSSVGGLKGSRNIGVYSVSKAADMQISRNIAVQYGANNIRANTIVPGLVRTDFARALWEDKDNLARVTANTPLQRIGEADDIAGAAVYLASDAGNFITGQTIVIDGGRMIADA